MKQAHLLYLGIVANWVIFITALMTRLPTCYDVVDLHW